VECRNPLVAEVPVQLINPLQTPGNQPFQIQFRGNPQVKIHPQRVVVGLEGPRHRSARPGLHHRGFDFQKIAILHEAANQLDDPASPLKHLPDLRIDHQIEVALAVPGFDIRQAVPLFRKHTNGFGHQAQPARLDGQLPCFCPEDPPFDMDDVSHIQLFEKLIRSFTDQLPVYIALNPALSVLQADERGFSEIPYGHDSSG